MQCLAMNNEICCCSEFAVTAREGKAMGVGQDGKGKGKGREMKVRRSEGTTPNHCVIVVVAQASIGPQFTRLAMVRSSLVNG